MPRPEKSQISNILLSNDELYLKSHPTPIGKDVLGKKVSYTGLAKILACYKVKIMNMQNMKILLYVFVSNHPKTWLACKFYLFLLYKALRLKKN